MGDRLNPLNPMRPTPCWDQLMALGFGLGREREARERGERERENEKRGYEPKRLRVMEEWRGS